ncbi:UDP-N-acetyl-D-mannosaminuronic acid transferase (WecB/TagA/CpsF family) [Paraburkholderia sp. Clong3]
MVRINLLGCPMDVTTMNETVALITERVRRGVFTQHVVVNAAKIVNARKDSELARSIKACDLINIEPPRESWRLVGLS